MSVADQPIAGTGSDVEAHQSPGDAAVVGSPRRGRHWLTDPVLWCLVAAVAVIWIASWPGAVVACFVGAGITPYGRRFQDRLFVFLLLGVGSVAAIVGIGDASVDALTARLILTALVLGVGAANLLLLQPGKRGPIFDWVSGIVALSFATMLWSMIQPFIGASSEQVLSGLIGGWDHSSHFAMLAGVHQQDQVAFVAHDGSPAMFSSYPNVHIQVWVLAISLVWGGAMDLTRVDLLGPYAFMAAGTVALSSAGMVAVAGDVARRVSEARVGAVASAAAALTCAVALLLGPATYMFNAGHVNFLLGVAVTIMGSWYAARSVATARTWGIPILVSGAISVAMLYPPLAVGFLASGLVVAHALLPRRRGMPVLLAALSLFAALALLRLSGIAPGSLVSSVRALTLWPGGYPPLNVSLAMAAPAAIAGFAAQARIFERRTPVVAAVSAAVGLTLVAAAFVLASLAEQVRLTSSYYTMKLAGGLSFSVLVLVSVLVSLWFAQYVCDVTAGVSSGRARVVGLSAWLGLAAVILPAAGYFGPMGGYLPAGSPLAAGWSAVQEREWLVDEVPEGSLILSASEALSRQDDVPLIWDGGDLKNNVWLSTLEGGMSSAEHGLVSSLPAPFGEEAAARLGVWLDEDPARAVQIAYFRSESAEVLEVLQKAHPGQVTLSLM